MLLTVFIYIFVNHCLLQEGIQGIQTSLPPSHPPPFVLKRERKKEGKKERKKEERNTSSSYMSARPNQDFEM